MVPGSTLRYGSSFRKRTLYPRACKRAPSAADARPFPKEETTPPVMKINRAMEGQHVERTLRTQAERFKIVTHSPRARVICANMLNQNGLMRRGNCWRRRSSNRKRRLLCWHGRNRRSGGRIEDGFLGASMQGEQVERQASQKEQNGENRSRARQGVRRTARREQSTKS